MDTVNLDTASLRRGADRAGMKYKALLRSADRKRNQERRRFNNLFLGTIGNPGHGLDDFGWVSPDTRRGISPSFVL